MRPQTSHRAMWLLSSNSSTQEADLTPRVYLILEIQIIEPRREGGHSSHKSLYM
jgi:hypothetical protein